MDNSLTTSGRYFKYKYWKNYYLEMRSILEKSGKLHDFIGDVKLMEIDSMAFYVNDIDKSDDWYKEIMSYDVSNYPRKIKILHRLLHYPSMLKFLVKTNRKLKKVFN